MTLSIDTKSIGLEKSFELLNDKIIQFSMTLFMLILIGYILYNPNKVNEQKAIAFSNGAILICSIMQENDVFTSKNSAIIDNKYVVNYKGLKYHLNKCTINTPQNIEGFK